MDQVTKQEKFDQERKEKIRLKLRNKMCDYCLDFYDVTRNQCNSGMTRLPQMQAVASFIELAHTYMYTAIEIAEEIGCDLGYINYVKTLLITHRATSSIYRKRVKEIIAHFDTEAL